MPLDVLRARRLWFRSLHVSRKLLKLIHRKDVFYPGQRDNTFSPQCVARCDRGFGGPYCVPVLPLPSVLKDDFNGNLHPDLWPEVYGAERGNLNGDTIKSGTALIFKGVRDYLHWKKNQWKPVENFIKIENKFSLVSPICLYWSLLARIWHFHFSCLFLP